MSDADIVWGMILLTGAVVEVWAILNKAPGDTLSERTRAWWHVRTRPGHVAFAVCWIVFATWFFFHILG